MSGARLNQRLNQLDYNKMIKEIKFVFTSILGTKEEVFLEDEQIEALNKKYTLREVIENTKKNFKTAYSSYWINVFIDGKEVYHRQSLKV